MTVFSLFHGLDVTAWTDDVDDPLASSLLSKLTANERYNVLFQKSDSIAVDDGDTVSILPANYSVSFPNDQIFVLLRVRGWAELQLSSKDYDDASDIDGYQRAYGDSIMPGILVLSSYNVATLAVKGLQDGTKIEYLFCVVCDDTDVRYEDYA